MEEGGGDVAGYTPRGEASGEPRPADASVSDFQPPDRENTSLLRSQRGTRAEAQAGCSAVPPDPAHSGPPASPHVFLFACLSFRGGASSY